jgi:radical SAM superfamily enzyme YgiQ (UPF0313 family)
VKLILDKNGTNFQEMKWLFIAPGNLAGDFSNVPNGIGILASLLELNNIPVKVKDYSVEPLDYEELRKIILGERITHVGVTFMTCQAPVAYRLTEFIRGLSKDVIIVSGGIHPTLLPEESLDNHVEVVYRDEAEISFTKSLPAIAKRPFDLNRLNEIKGLSFQIDGKMVSTPNAERVRDLDSIPLPAYHLFHFPERYTTQFLYKGGFSTNLITSRGCTGHCFFCSKHYQGVTFQSAERVVEQFVFLRDKYHISQIFVQDDFFTHDLERVEKICDLLIKNRVNVPWVCSNTRADSISYELFKKMRESGCISVSFGIESGNEKVRKKIGKNLNTEDIFNAVTAAKRAGLLTGAFYICGHHCETWEEAMDTIRFAKKLNTDVVTFSINCPFPGTPFYKMLTRKGVELTKDWGKYRTWGEPLFQTEFLSKEQIVDLQKRAYREYYLRGAYLARQTRNLLTTGMFLMYWRGFKWILEQYFDYKIMAKNRPLHLKSE